MPVNEEINGGTLYYEKEDGTYVQIGEVSEDGTYVQIGEVSKVSVQDFEPLLNSLVNYHLVYDGGKISAEIRVDEKLLSNRIRYITNVFGMNNWRKMHGIPMIRRVQKRRKRTK